MPCTCIHPSGKINVETWSNFYLVTMNSLPILLVPSGCVVMPCCTWIQPLASLLVSYLLPSWYRRMLVPTILFEWMLSHWVIWVVIGSDFFFLNFGNRWPYRSFFCSLMHILSNIFLHCCIICCVCNHRLIIWGVNWYHL